VINKIPTQGKQNIRQENGHHHHDQTPHPDEDKSDFHAPRKEPDLFTCPMHPEILQDRSGSCPKYGMALEPKGEAGQWSPLNPYR
jgi:Cu+-exporting ATPase